MPLFVMISGYFSKHENITKLCHGIPKLLETYIVMCLVAIFFTHYKYELKSPTMSEWYLLSLIFWRICAYIINKLKISNRIIITLSFIGAFAAFFLLGKHSYTFAAMRTMLFLPYFIIGYFMTTDDLQSIRNKKNLWILMSLPFLITLVVASLYFPRLIHVMEFNRDGILTISNLFGCSYISTVMGKVFFYIAGILFCYVILALKVNNRNLAKLGRYTLFFYCIQMYFIQIPAERMGLLQNIWQSIALTMFALFASCLTTRKRLLVNIVTNPLYTVIYNIKDRLK